MNKDLFTTDVSMKNIKITDKFWGNYIELCRTKMIPYQWEALNDRIEGAEPSGCIRNFRIAAGLEEGEFYGHKFQDSDVAKWIEAVAYTLINYPDESLEATADKAIDLIVSAQQENGYLDTYGIINGEAVRWTELINSHELYCAGHMLEAAVAYYQATGKRKLLDAMLKFTDHIDSVFGTEEGKLRGYDGHPIIEMALMRLYSITKDEKHLKLAKYFVDERGQSPLYLEEECKKYNRPFKWEKSYFKYMYYQAGMPVRDQKTAEGHAVRGLYLYSGMADVAAATNDDELMKVCEDIWHNIVYKRMYITGAVGSSRTGEAFTFDYDLPNDTVYGETCASVALAFFAHRMLKANPKSEYADVLEKLLYNGIISGVQLDGQSFFYVNPLEVFPEACEKSEINRHVKPVRQKWFGCACCPPNLARIVTSISSYLYTVGKDTLFVHLYAGSETELSIGENKLKLNVETDYPYDGKVKLNLNSDKKDLQNIKLALRIPGWCRNYSIMVNGENVTNTSVKDGYIYITKLSGENNVIEFDMDMPVKLIRANPLVRHNTGRAAVMRGPLVYCLEETDNGKNLANVELVSDGEFNTVYEEILGGVKVIYAEGLREAIGEETVSEPLYMEYSKPHKENVVLKYIPYYAWCNRTPGEMAVWVRTV